MSRTIYILALTALMGCPKPQPAPTPEPQAAEVELPEIPYERYELDNGLTVILAPDHSTPIVYTNVWYHVGSRDEVDGLTGFAHLFEHLMFQGSANAPGEYFTPLQEVGATINGTTSFDRTNYFEEVPAQHLPLALFMESDRMGHLLEVLDIDKLDNQREVVKNERRQRYENPPYGEAWKTLYEHAFPAGHPYAHMPIGSHEDLTAASLEDVQDFFRTWYVPNNASLVVAGDFDTDTAKGLIEQYFGPIPRGEDPVRRTAEPYALPEPIEIVQYDDVPEQKVWVAYPSPAFYAEGDAEMDLLASVLSGGKDSRLYTALVKEQQIAKDIGAYQSSMGLGSLFVFYGTAAAGHTTEELVAAMDAVVADVLSENPPTADEIDAAKTDFEANFYAGLQTISGKGDTLNRYEMYTGNPGFIGEDLTRYLEATPADVLAAGQRVLATNRVALHILPEDARPATDEGGAE